MSRLTGNLLRTMDYSGIKARREQNYRLLSQLLPFKECFYREVPEGRLPIRIIIRTDWSFDTGWQAGRFFVPTNWRNILEEFDRDTMEYDWAANVLPLPVTRDTGQKKCSISRIP